MEGQIFKKDPQEELRNSESLKRILTPFDLILLGIGAVIGAGLFSITGIAAAENAGPAIVISFVIAAIGCTFAGLCYSELAGMIPIAGSAYSYSYAIMGPFIGFLVGWTLVLEYAIGAATVSISWSAYVLSILQDLQIPFPTDLSASKWQSVLTPSGEKVYGLINLPALLIVFVLSLLLIIGVRKSARFNALIVCIKLMAVFLFILFGAFYIRADNLTPFIPENSGHFGEFGFSGILRAAGVLFFAYVGFDAVSTSAQEVKNPSRSIPIGILGSLWICTLIYVLFGFVLTGLVSYKKLDVAAPVAVAVRAMPFPWLNGIIKLAILAGFTSVILVMLFGQSRIFYAMSKDMMLPECLSKIHKKYGTPWVSHLFLMFFVGLIAAFFPISLISKMTSIGTLLAFVIVCTGVLVLRIQRPDLHRPFKAPFTPFTPIAGIVVCLVMMLALEIDTWIRLFVWLGVGLMVYFGYSRKKQTLKNN